MKKVHFDEEYLAFFDEEGNVRADLIRFKTINAFSSRSFSDRKLAEANVEDLLQGKGRDLGARAYELVSLQVHDSNTEYDSTPYTSSATAILYR